jgi:hypothetical protein
VAGRVNQDIPIAQNAAESANDKPIEIAKDAITEKPLNVAV